MSTIITTKPNGEVTMTQNDNFSKPEFRYKEPRSYKDVLNDTTPTFRGQDIASKEMVECLVGKINSILQQEVRSDECKFHADNGEVHYIPDAKLKDIWKVVEEKYPKRVLAFKERLLKCAGKPLAREGYYFDCEKSNTDQPDKWFIARNVNDPDVGESFLDKWLKGEDDEDKVRKNILKPQTPEAPESEGGDVILPDSVQIPHQPQPEPAGTEE